MSTAILDGFGTAPDSQFLAELQMYDEVKIQLSGRCRGRTPAGTRWTFPLLAVTVLVTAMSDSSAMAQKISAEQLQFFESKIRPVLVRECYSCHSDQAGQQKGGLRLDTKNRLELGGDSGPAIVAGNPNDSLLLMAINYEDYRMPPAGQLPENVIADFRDWIEMGAPDPRTLKIETIQSTVSAADVKKGRQFWSFTRPKSKALPEIDDADWPRNPVDLFVRQKLLEENLTSAADAAPDALLRRLTFDLVGLPPALEQQTGFLTEWAEDPDSAIERVVDELLASEQFGERWGRHWLDVARYAESTGREVNATFPNAWRYRNYVIDSFNADKPYDDFITEQIAGDLLPAKTDEQWAEQLIATGFLAMGPKSLAEQNARQFKLDLVDDQIDTTTRVVLGVSVACARCHDHKFDPIQQRDYYAMAGIFESMTTHYGTIDSPQNRRPGNELILPIDDPNPYDESISPSMLKNLASELDEKKELLRELQRQRQEARRAGNNGADLQRSFANLTRTVTQIAAIEAKINSVDNHGQPLSFCLGVQETDQPVNARLLVRGEFDQPSGFVERGFVQVLSRRPTRIDADSSGRLELARWLTNKNNPLTARVMVNRIWQHVFGQGLVTTPEDFGATGQRPSHPELLDYLAIEFMRHQWSIKHMVRLLVTSHTYRMSTALNPDHFERDPENRFLWRANPRQLDAESLRDAMLFASGTMDFSRPPASLVAKAGSTIVRDGRLISFRTGDSGRDSATMSMEGQSSATGTDSGPRRRLTAYEVDELNRHRSIYLPIVRDNLPRALDVFDFAEPGMVVGVRESSNTPSQGLYLLNNELVIKASEAMARRLLNEADNTDDRIRLAFRLACGREIGEAELQSSRDFFETFVADIGTTRNRGSRLSRKLSEARRLSAEQQKLAALAQAIMASAEFRYTN